MTKDCYIKASNPVAAAFTSLAAILMVLTADLPAWAHGHSTKVTTAPSVTVNATSVGVSTAAADNTADIKKALSKIGSNGTVYFPAGTYQFAGPIVLGSGQHFAGAGPSQTTLVNTNYSSSDNAVVSIGGTGASVSNLAVSTTTSGKAMSGVAIHGAKSFAIENVQFSSDLWCGLYITNSSGGTVEGNVFNQGTGYEIFGNTVASLAIEHNTFVASNNGGGPIAVNAISSSQISFNNFTGPGGALRDAITLTGSGPTGLSKGVVIASNVINCSPFPGRGMISIIGAGKSLGVDGIEIINNTITLGTGTNYWNQYASAIWVYGTAGSMANVSVLDNIITCDANPTFWPVGIMLGQTGSDALNDVTGLTISGNTLSSLGYGILCDGSTTTKIDSNTISNCQGLAIYVEGYTGGSLDVSSNKLLNCGVVSPSGQFNLYFDDTAALMVVGSRASPLTIDNNSYGSASQANNLSYFILCDVPSAQGVRASGNTTTTTLSSYLAP